MHGNGVQDVHVSIVRDEVPGRMLTYGAVCGGVSFVFRGVEAGINQQAVGDPFQEGKEGAAIRG